MAVAKALQGLGHRQAGSAALILPRAWRGRMVSFSTGSGPVPPGRQPLIRSARQFARLQQDQNKFACR